MPPRPAIPYFPRLRLMPDRTRHTPVLRIPARAVRNVDLPAEALTRFAPALLGSRTDASRLPDLMRQMAREDRAAYQRGFGEAIRPMVELALDLHGRSFGLDPSTWTDGSDAQRAAYTVDLTPPEGGHAAAVVTLEGLPNARQAVSDPTLARCLAGAFPGQFAAIPDDVRLQMLTAGRRPDGTIDDVLAENASRIRAYNAKAFADRAPMSGLHAIGWNSFVGAETHFTAGISADILYQSVLMVTGAAHSQRGVVPWTTMYHPDFPGGVVCVSLHFGHTDVAGGDLANSAVSGPLFKSLFRGGVSLYGMRELLVSRLGVDVANHLLLDPAVDRAFREVWGGRDFAFLRDRAVLSVMDRTGGRVLNALGMFSSTPVPTDGWTRGGLEHAVAAVVEALPRQHVHDQGRESTTADAKVLEEQTRAVEACTEARGAGVFAGERRVAVG